MHVNGAVNMIFAFIFIEKLRLPVFGIFQHVKPGHWAIDSVDWIPNDTIVGVWLLATSVYEILLENLISGASDLAVKARARFLGHTTGLQIG